jgi:hypothetical protein
LQPDGKIVVIGSGELARFQNDALPLVIPPGPPPAPPKVQDNPVQSQPAQNAVVSFNSPPVAVSSSAPANSLLLDASSQALPNPVIVSVPTLTVSASPSATVPTTESAPSNADPFGIHLVGGAGSVVSDSTDDANVLTGPAPVETTTQTALPSASRQTPFAAPTVVLDVIFQFMPLWTRAAFLASPLPTIEAPLPPSSEQAAPAAPVVNGSHAAALPRWPALAAGAMLSLGLVGAEAERSRRRVR